MGVPINGCFIRENPIKVDDLGVPPFQEMPKRGLCGQYGEILESIY